MKPLRPIPFGDYLPDLPEFSNPGSVNIKNVLPSAQGYRQMPGQNVFSDALDARCQGATTQKENDGTVWTFAGDATKLYRLVDASWSDSSGATYTIASDQNWEFAKFNETVIATNIADPVQKITLGGTTFSDLFTSSLTPKARHLGVTDDFLILGHTEESGTVHPSRVRWSALGDIADMDQSATTQADSQDLSEFGWVMGIVGVGRDAYIFQERAVRVMRYEGTPTIFRFDLAEQNRGAIAPMGIVSFGRHAFYLADDGFYAFDGASSRPIGKEKVDRFFYDDADATYLRESTYASIDPSRSLVMWAYRSNSASVGAPVCDRMLVYSWMTDKWSLVEVDNEVIFRDLTKGYTLEGLDDVSATLEGLPFSLDSRVWAGGLIMLSGFDNDHKLVNYNGDALTAEVDTTEVQHHPGRTSFVDAVRPLVEGADATITVAPVTRDKLNEDESAGTAQSLNALGEADMRSVARFHRYRVSIAGGFDHAQGVQVESIPWGRQ